MRAGADAAEACVGRHREVEVKVRAGRTERTLDSGGTGCGLRVDLGRRQALASTTDLSREGIAVLVATALGLAAEAPEDPEALLSKAPAPDPRDLDLDDPAFGSFGVDEAAALAGRAEASALAFDGRVGAGEGARTVAARGEVALVSTAGTSAFHAGTRWSISCHPVAAAGGERQRQFWYESRRHLADLPSPESVGLEAARRAIGMLGAKPIAPRRLAVVLDPLEAPSFWASLTPALTGDAARRRTSFLADELGRPVASTAVNLADDPLVPRAPGSRRTDGEGWPTSRRVLMEKGVLTSFLYDLRSARRAGVSSTGNAVRSYASLPAPGAHAPSLEPGTASLEELLAAAGSCLLVTHLIGFGTNLATGDFSRGASGWLCERGEPVHPVTEVTLSGNLREILERVALVGRDVVRRSAAASPAFLIDGMVVSGGRRGA